MRVIGSGIARLRSKRLIYKNLLPFGGAPLVGMGIERLRCSSLVDEIVVSTESELIARIAMGYGVEVLRRPKELSGDDIPSIPVFRHIVANYPCDVHVNYNVNFPICPPDVIDRAVGIAVGKGESLSVPFAVWAQTSECLNAYGDPWQITASRFADGRIGLIDIHTEEDLLGVYRREQGPIEGWEDAESSADTDSCPNSIAERVAVSVS